MVDLAVLYIVSPLIDINYYFSIERINENISVHKHEYKLTKKVSLSIQFYFKEAQNLSISSDNFVVKKIQQQSKSRQHTEALSQSSIKKSRNLWLGHGTHMTEVLQMLSSKLAHQTNKATTGQRRKKYRRKYSGFRGITENFVRKSRTLQYIF